MPLVRLSIALNLHAETTQKVLSERRMLFLRDLANSAGQFDFEL